MTSTAGALAQRLWSAYALVREDSLSRTEYLEELAPLLLLKLDHERTESPWRQTATMPRAFDWMTLLAREGDELLAHYGEVLAALATLAGLPGVIFQGARCRIRHPVKLRQLIVDVVDREQWMAASGEARAEAWEILIERTALEPRAPLAGHSTPRVLTHAIMDVIRPQGGESLCDPACGTGAFLTAAIDRDQRSRTGAVLGIESSPTAARLAALSLYFRGVQAGEHVGLVGGGRAMLPEGRRFDVVCAAVPLSRRVTADALDRASPAEVVQAVRAVLSPDGRAAVIVPDSFLSEGGPSEELRRHLLDGGTLHTILRLAPGSLPHAGVRANVLFFDGTGSSGKATDVWVYDLRTGILLDPRAHPLRQTDFDEFGACFSGSDRKARQETWSPENPGGRWRRFSRKELLRRNGANLDVLWLDEESMQDAGAALSPDALAGMIVQDLRSALAQFEAIRMDLASGDPEPEAPE